MDIGNKIKQIRKAKGFTQVELSKLAKISRSYLADVESNRYHPSIDTLSLISKALDVDVAELLSKEEYEKRAVKVKVYGKIPAGIPIEAVEDVIDYEEIPADWLLGGKQYIALKVSGESMYPKYLDGDIVIIRLQPTCESGQDAAVYVNGYDVTLKKVILKEKQTILQPLNPAFEPLVFDRSEEDLSILGVVVELRRKICVS